MCDFPGNGWLLNLRGFLLTRERRYADARECFLNVLAGNPDTGAFRLTLLNNIAYADALMAKPEMMDEADRYSEEAYEAAPWVPSFAGTRGTVLVKQGKIEEGIDLLKTAFQKNEDIRSKATSASHLSIAEKKRGNLAESERYLQIARKLDPDCPLLKDAVNV